MQLQALGTPAEPRAQRNHVIHCSHVGKDGYALKKPEIPEIFVAQKNDTNFIHRTIWERTETSTMQTYLTYSYKAVKYIYFTTRHPPPSSIF